MMKTELMYMFWW